MKSVWVLGLVGLFAAACGGSVDGDGSGGTSSGGKAGSSGAGGSSAGTGGSGGSGATGGSGGSASGGTSGSGGSATGGAGGISSCCTGDLACPSGSECISNSCKPIPPDMSCWRDDDCPFGLCVNAAPCPCGTVCKDEHMGQCLAPPDSGCCNSDADCASLDPGGVVCVSGRCLPPVGEGCWKDSQCPQGQSCVGASVCPCNVVCGVADMPGKCQ